MMNKLHGIIFAYLSNPSPARSSRLTWSGPPSATTSGNPELVRRLGPATAAL